jgi:hypothetical protein
MAEPWHADPMPGGYAVRDANGQTLAFVYSRDNEDEARQAKVLTKTRRDGSPSTSRGCRSCSEGRTTTKGTIRVERPGGSQIGDMVAVATYCRQVPTQPGPR